jgi:hypothetical protein
MSGTVHKCMIILFVHSDSQFPHRKVKRVEGGGCGGVIICVEE